jgi:hypothetical protein
LVLSLDEPVLASPPRLCVMKAHGKMQEKVAKPEIHTWNVNM